MTSNGNSDDVNNNDQQILENVMPLFNQSNQYSTNSMHAIFAENGQYDKLILFV
jgi:hypothetical protein